MIELEDITTGEVAGRGFYDELMRTTKAHLLEEYGSGRIIGADYANVYLGAMQANLSQSVQVVLNYELNNQRLLVLQEQVKQAQKQNELLDLQKLLLQLQIDTGQYNLDNLMPAQLDQTTKQTALIEEQTNTQVTQTQLVGKQVTQADAQTSMISKQEELVTAQIATELTNTNTPTAGISKARYDKSTKEIEVLEQRRITEEAQTVGDADSIGGMMGGELSLKLAQRDSFIRDSEQKAAKFYADVLSIVYSTNPDGADADPALWGFGPADSSKVTDSLLAGIGVTP